MERTHGLKSKLRQKAPLIGTFMKTPAAQAAEALAGSRLDLVCIDGEHGPFDRGSIDLCLMALRARDMPAIVRVPSAAHDGILAALDSGAAGIMVPHIISAAGAADVAKAAHFGPGGRGFAGSPRSADYGPSSMAAYLAQAAQSTVVIAQIEDVAALDHLDAIAQVDGIDALFIGRMDLTVGMGASSPDAPEVVAAAEKICAVGVKYGRTIGMFVPDVAEAAKWRALGASLFILGSDHGFIRQGANSLAERFHSP
jgi:2-keto-3-deoxy-L-rhamnonate aldolase RhmA